MYKKLKLVGVDVVAHDVADLGAGIADLIPVVPGVGDHGDGVAVFQAGQHVIAGAGAGAHPQAVGGVHDGALGAVGDVTGLRSGFGRGLGRGGGGDGSRGLAVHGAGHGLAACGGGDHGPALGTGSIDVGDHAVLVYGGAGLIGRGPGDGALPIGGVEGDGEGVGLLGLEGEVGGVQGHASQALRGQGGGGGHGYRRGGVGIGVGHIPQMGVDHGEHHHQSGGDDDQRAQEGDQSGPVDGRGRSGSLTAGSGQTLAALSGGLGVGAIKHILSVKFIAALVGHGGLAGGGLSAAAEGTELICGTVILAAGCTVHHVGIFFTNHGVIPPLTIDTHIVHVLHHFVNP